MFVVFPGAFSLSLIVLVLREFSYFTLTKKLAICFLDVLQAIRVREFPSILHHVPLFLSLQSTENNGKRSLDV